MNWFNKLFPSRISTNGIARRTVPEGIWTKCEKCNAILYRAELERNIRVCPKCAHHMRISARQRLGQFLDPESHQEIGKKIKPVDALRFKDNKRYRDRLSQAQRKTGEDDALVVIRGKLKNIPVVSCAFDFDFMGGSMGSVVGERFVLATEVAKINSIPLICFSASGGARMQETFFSLMQMAKTSSALAELKRNNIPYISVLTNPTTGGVSASLAFLGDINIAEPDALIGFAGPRVIEQTVRATLPEGFQRSDFLLKHGNIDIIIDRREQRNRIASIISILMHQPLSLDDVGVPTD